MKKIRLTIGLLILSFLSANAAFGEGLPWLDHQDPFNFKFGNHIDTHQQSMVMPSGDLLGYLYVEFTGEYNPDGIPIAKHSNCNGELAECTVGWQWRGVPGQATFVYHENGDHPIWLVNYRSDIPQPGGYSHFHWLGSPDESMNLVEEKAYEGYFLELIAKDTFVFKHGNEEILITPGLDISTHLNIVSIFPVLTDHNGGNGNNKKSTK